MTDTKTVLITGITGQDGSCLTRLLRDLHAPERARIMIVDPDTELLKRTLVDA